MTEFELKFEVPAASLQGVRDAMLHGKSQSPCKQQRLQASYFDTPDGALAARGLVVRLRKEGRRWVQTAKGPTADLLARLEHNSDVPQSAAGTHPALDLARHDGTPIGSSITAALASAGDRKHRELSLIYSTDIKRVTTSVIHNHSVVEVALDQGRVFSGSASQSICELELELKSGSAIDAVTLAQQWRGTHGLWLSTIAKSMKGQRLGQALAHGAATPAIAPRYAKDVGASDMVTAVVAACLRQMLPNMSELAGSSGSTSKSGSGSGSGSSSGSGSNQPDHIHQLRVGIRRLRTALRELGGSADGIDPKWEAALVSTFRALGAHRDQSNLALSLQPQLVAAGGPVMHIAATDDDQIASHDIVRAADFQDALLSLIAFVHRDVLPSHGDAEPLIKTISRRLDKLYKRALRDGKKFLSLDDEQQHDVRKRIKRLRYLLEFAAPLFAERKVNRMIAALKPVQDALGLYNDELMALHAWRALAADDANAWFGIGWLTARKQPNAQQCLKAIKVFAEIKPFWRG